MKSYLLDRYDFVVFGTHPSVLWGAVLLLERGLKVLVLPMLTEPSVESDLSGHFPKIDTYASHRFAPLFLFDSILSPIPESQHHQFQVLTSQHRFRLHQTSESFQQEWDFHFGKNKVDPTKIVSTGSVQAIQRGIGYWARGYESSALNMDDLRFVLSMRNKFIELKEGIPSLCELLFLKIKNLGGHIDLRACQNVFIDKKSFVGVQLVGNSVMISAASALIGSGLGQLQSFVSEPSVFGKSEPMGWRFEVKVEVSIDAIPVGITSKMVFADRDAPLVEMIHGKQGHFTLRTLMPMSAESLSREYQRKIAQRLVKLFSNYIPDLEYNLRSVYPDIRDPERAETEDLVKAYPFTELAKVPFPLLSYGVSGMGHFSSIQGFYFGNEESYPRQGHWGAYQAVYWSVLDWAKRNQRTDFINIPSPI